MSQCEENYLELLMSSGVKKEEEDTREVKTITGKITKIAQAVLEGTSHYLSLIHILGQMQKCRSRQMFRMQIW